MPNECAAPLRFVSEWHHRFGELDMTTIYSLLTVFGPILVIILLASALETLRPEAPRKKDTLRWIHASVLYLTCNLLVFLVVPGGHLGVIQFTQLESWGLLHVLPVPYALAVAVGLLALDFSEWFAHVVLHRVPVLWRLHRIHHSDQHIDIATSLRFHPIEAVLRYLIGLAFIVILGIPALSVVIFTFAVLVFNAWEHANIRIPSALRPLGHVIMTPEFHRVHHSEKPEHMHSNYGVIFSIWDKLAGTRFWYTSGERLTYGLGVDDTDLKHDVTLAKLLFEPFRRSTIKGNEGNNV